MYLHKISFYCQTLFFVHRSSEVSKTTGYVSSYFNPTRQLSTKLSRKLQHSKRPGLNARSYQQRHPATQPAVHSSSPWMYTKRPAALLPDTAQGHVSPIVRIGQIHEVETLEMSI
uniref:Uncharacterized protein n=1 Tax=Cacopsylla melanoneura TaxID=428564 RepID=A0A8D9DNC0_9HEMI